MNSLNKCNEFNINKADFIVSSPVRRRGSWERLVTPLYRCYRQSVQSLVCEEVYYASSSHFKSKMDDIRLEESRELLRAIGGEPIVIKTIDKINIEAMYFSVKKFREAISNMGGEFDYQQFNDKYKQPVLVIRTNKLFHICKKFRIEVSDGVNKQVNLARPANYNRGRLIDTSRSVSILTQGNGSIFEMDRGNIAKTLLTGQDCIVYNIRGTGRSQGKPSEIGTYCDIEAVYQCLVKKKKYLDRQITVVGYCLGGGAAVELAQNHPQINLTLDRSFRRVGDIVAEVAQEKLNDTINVIGIGDINSPRLLSFTSSVINVFIISYDNESKLPKVKGNVCIIDASEDNVIPERSPAALRQQTRTAASQTAITIQGGHCDFWDGRAERNYSEHLDRIRSLHDFGVTRKWSLTELGNMFGSSLVPHSSKSAVGASESSHLASR